MFSMLGLTGNDNTNNLNNNGDNKKSIEELCRIFVKKRKARSKLDYP
jgi:hypothetical protein